MTNKTFKCKYCNFHGTREELVFHTDDEHEELIPKGYSSARVVFNNINKKEYGTCVSCKRKTEWNEKNWKYHRLCGRLSCKKAQREAYEKNMIKIYNKTTLLDDAEYQQNNMLAHRSISGTYKFQDGGIRSYTGSYEKKTLEFMDKVLNIPSYDIDSPGPIFEYQFEGKELKWITDIYYIPANLVIEVKDGGSNPNNRQMDSYRAKQIEKEKMITNLGTYNYLRLTDNNFEQLLLILAELKQQMVDDSIENKKTIITINEEVGGIPPSTPFNNGNVYLIPYGYNNILFLNKTEEYGFTRSLDLTSILIIDENRNIKSVPIDFLENRRYNVYKYNRDDSIEKYKVLLNSYSNNEVVDEGYFYSLFSEKEMLSEDQIDFDSDFEKIDFDKLKITLSIQENSILSNINTLANNSYYESFEISNKNNIIYKESILEKYPNINILEDVNGYFAINIDTTNRTESFKNIKDININVLDVLSLMKEGVL